MAKKQIMPLEEALHVILATDGDCGACQRL
jgi:hypothetical protein